MRSRGKRPARTPPLLVKIHSSKHHFVSFKPSSKPKAPNPSHVRVLPDFPAPVFRPKTRADSPKVAASSPNAPPFRKVLGTKWGEKRPCGKEDKKGNKRTLGVFIVQEELKEK